MPSCLRALRVFVPFVSSCFSGSYDAAASGQDIALPPCEVIYDSNRSGLRDERGREERGGQERVSRTYVLLLLDQLQVAVRRESAVVREMIGYGTTTARMAATTLVARAALRAS